MFCQLARVVEADKLAVTTLPQKASWLEHCVKAGLPRAVVAFGLFGHREGPYNAANNANANLLQTVGSPIFCATMTPYASPYCRRSARRVRM